MIKRLSFLDLLRKKNTENYTAAGCIPIKKISALLNLSYLNVFIKINQLVNPHAIWIQAPDCAWSSLL